MKIILPDTIKRAEPNQWRQLGDITGEAFANDPINQWIFGKPAAITSMFTVLARELYIKHGHCYLAGDGGATMWLPPEADAAPTISGLLRFALAQLRHGSFGGIKRGLAVSALMEEWHPKDPHMYLFSIGTRQSARGKGVGKALLAPVLAACDEAKMPVYLENSNPDNSGFYGAHGFERMGTFEVCEGGPIMEPMWREPRAPIS